MKNPYYYPFIPFIVLLLLLCGRLNSQNLTQNIQSAVTEFETQATLSGVGSTAQECQSVTIGTIEKEGNSANYTDDNSKIQFRNKRLEARFNHWVNDRWWAQTLLLITKNILQIFKN